MSTETVAESGEPKQVIYGSGVPPHFAEAVILRCKSAVAKPSKAGQPMIEAHWEIVKPETYDSPFTGKRYMMDKASIPSYILLWELDKNGKVLQTGLSFLNEVLLPRLDMGDKKFDPANPLYDAEKNPNGIPLSGLIVEAVVQSEEKIEQRRLPNGQYEQLRDSKGQPISSGWVWSTLNVGTILRRATVDTNNAF